MVFESQSVCRIMGPGDITILRQDSAFRLYCRDTGYTGVSYNASGNVPEEFKGEAEVLKATANIKTIARLMDQLLESAPSHSSQELPGLALALAWESIRLSEKINSLSARTRTPYELADTAKALLQSHIYTSAGVKEILSPLPLSHRHLCRYFKKQYGISPKQFQLQSKINEAERLLVGTSLTITDIAMELGFASSQHFSTQFKKQTGRTPTEWRTS